MMRLSLYMVMTSLVALSCTNPFSGRDSEAPSEPEGTFLSPVRPQIVVYNLENSYNEKIISHYTQCFDTQFVFRYDYLMFGKQADSGWSYATEMSLTSSMFAKYRQDADSSKLTLVLKMTSNTDTEDDTSATIEREYSLKSVSIRSDGLRDTTEYVGTATFELIETGFNLWAIREWRDFHQSSADTSWADFKNGFR